jgi:sulfatase maturation enzyme AslB (radical SAM superfamily)
MKEMNKTWESLSRGVRAALARLDPDTGSRVDTRPLQRISAQQQIPENLLLLSDPLSPPRAPRTLELAPHDSCNHACHWCFTKPYRDTRSSTVAAIADRLRAFAASGGVAVHISGGGEPFLFKPIWEPHAVMNNATLLEYASYLRLLSGVITNGRFLDRLPPLSSLSLAFVRVSLDAADAQAHSQRHGCGTGDFAKILANIADLVSQRGNCPVPALGISAIVDPTRGQSAPLPNSNASPL